MITIVISAVALIGCVGCGSVNPLKESLGAPHNESVQEMMTRVSSLSCIIREDEVDWIVFKDQHTLNYWAFVREDHPAYPSAVMTTFLPGRGAYLDTIVRVQCEAESSVCDRLRFDVGEMSASVLHP
jgi:hypothetical protein